MAPKPGGDSPEVEVGKDLAGGGSRRMSTVKAGLDVDTKNLDKMAEGIEKVEKQTSALQQTMDDLTGSADKAGTAVQGVSSGKGKTAHNGQPSFNSTSLPPPTIRPPAAPGTPADKGKASMSPGMNFWGARGFATAVQSPAPIIGAVAGRFGGMVTGAMDSRIERGREYASSASKLSVLTQQMTGMSQSQVFSSRAPMQSYRLGQGGVNSVQAFQNQTGFQGTPELLSAIEGQRVMSGFSRSAADILAEQTNMMSAPVNNRMFNMTGISAIGMGGKMNDPAEVNRQLIKRFGLDQNGMGTKALAPGNRIAAIMADSGISADKITSLAQQGAASETFQAAGGQGMYDPSKKSHRKLAGIADSLATEEDEGVRRREQREESFTRAQIENFTKAEKLAHVQIGWLESIDSKLAGAFGLRAKYGGMAKVAGRALQIGGAAAMFAPGGQIPGAIALGVGTAISGDGPDEEGEAGAPGAGSPGSGAGGTANLSVPFGYKGNGPGPSIPFASLASKTTWTGLNSNMKSRLTSLFKASGGRVGIGGGKRDPEAQKRMFLDRHVETTQGNHDRTWNGKFWKLVKGAPAAPPGSSMHEIGLAADLVGDMGWLQQNAAKFGLKTFANVNNEPWHVQPAELPNSRRKYEDAGAAWGTDKTVAPPGNEDDAVNTAIATDENVEHPTGAPGGRSGGLSFGANGMSISDIIAMYQADQVGGGGGGGGSTPGGGGRTSSRSTPSLLAAPAAGGGGTGVAVAAQAAYAAGFRGDDLVKIVAIAGRESGWKNTMRNDTADTGMWQINWKANEKYARLAGAGNREELLDVNVNARAAFGLYKASGFHGWKASGHSQYLIDRGLGEAGWDPNGNEMWHTEDHIAPATQATSQYMSGDGPSPMESMGAGSAPAGRNAVGAPVTVTNAPVINVNPTINFSGGTPATQDLRHIANEVGRMLQDEVSKLDMRTA